MEKEQAIKEFIKSPQEFDYLMIAPLQAKRQLESGFFRSQVFEKYGEKCVVCGKTNNLTIHHKNYEIILPKNIRKISTVITRSYKFKDEIRNIGRSKRGIYWYKNEDEKWQIIANNFPDIFEFNINNVEVLCWRCHKKKHRQLEQDTGSFMPIKEEHKK